MGIESPSLVDLIQLIYRESFLPIIMFLADIVRSLFPWPAVVSLLIIIAIFRPAGFVELLSTIGRLELPGGIKYEGRTPSRELQKELNEAAKVVESANKEIREAYESAKFYASSLREQYEIPLIASELAVQVSNLIGSDCPDDYRLTLYVPDFVFSDRLYQLTEYYNKEGKRVSDDRAGRNFSIRYGVIGRVWRSRVSEIEGDLISPQDRAQLGEGATVQEIEKFIARRWGLTLEEAVRIRPYNSYGAILLEGGGRSVGVLYFDSKKRNAFGDSSQVEKEIKKFLDQSVINQKLLEISSEIAPWSGRIQIFRSL